MNDFEQKSFWIWVTIEHKKLIRIKHSNWALSMCVRVWVRKLPRFDIYAWRDNFCLRLVYTQKFWHSSSKEFNQMKKKLIHGTHIDGLCVSVVFSFIQNSIQNKILNPETIIKKSNH